MHPAVPPARLLYVPHTHAVHVAEVLDAGVVLYCPDGQLVHPAVPVTSAAYCPTAHPVQTAEVAAWATPP